MLQGWLHIGCLVRPAFMADLVALVKILEVQPLLCKMNTQEVTCFQASQKCSTQMGCTMPQPVDHQKIDTILAQQKAVAF